ncbi:MAG TPA: SGNH/GDSL hydrolase family protein [Actinomycetota bacterium]|nr:SGNH/GDSL hydrolase family protein [Actinomycetota bacterium]
MSDRTKSRLGSLSGFVGVMVAVELFARSVSPSLPVDPGKWPRIEIAQKLDQMRRYVEDGEDFSVAFVGSSMVADGLDPVAFTKRSGIRAYNAAFAGPSMRTITPWTLDIAEPMLQPDAIVLGIQSRELSDNGPKNLKMFESFMASPGYRQTTSNLALRFAGVLERVSYFMRYRRAFREPSQLLDADGRAALQEARVRQQLGPLGKRIQKDVAYEDSEHFRTALYEKMLYDFEVGGPEYAALKKLAAELKDRDVRLIVLGMPVTDGYWAAHRRPDAREAYHHLLERFLDEAGVTFVDAEDALPPETFRNPMHLDIEARRWLARALGASWDELTAPRPGRFSVRCVVTQGFCRVERDPAASS